MEDDRDEGYEFYESQLKWAYFEYLDVFGKRLTDRFSSFGEYYGEWVRLNLPPQCANQEV